MISFKITAQRLKFETCDMLMFTSKQAVVSANNIDTNWINYPCLAIGKATKRKIEELGGKVLFSPQSFYAKVLAKGIQEQFSDKKLLYLRPKEVSFDSKAYLKEQSIELEEQIIYETFCVKYLNSQKPKENAIIIFTSPSTIKCFFKNFKWDSSYMAVLIGNATQKHLPYYCDFVVSDEALIDSCIKKALEIRKNNVK